MNALAKKTLVVGAGFAGAVHARIAAEAGYDVLVIDQRDHIGGNAYDSFDANGNRVHRYGPHLFHTNNKTVVDWLSRFTEWVEYRHTVAAQLPGGRLCPLPINRTTIEMIFDRKFGDADEINAFLASQAVRISQPENAAEYLYSRIGRTLTDLFFRPYTKKMWALDLEELDASVVKRIPLRTDHSVEYFPDDKFQFLPRDGYTKLFQAMLDHENIEICLKQTFDTSMERDFGYVFNSMAIDEYFQQAEGPLPYRSIRFHQRDEASPPDGLKSAVLNFTDAGPFTRETYWGMLPLHRKPESAAYTVSKEEPCDYTDNNYERYYPVKKADGSVQATYERYKERAATISDRMAFIGRCGTYQYLDMHQVVNQSLVHATKWVAERPL